MFWSTNFIFLTSFFYSIRNTPLYRFLISHYFHISKVHIISSRECKSSIFKSTFSNPAVVDTCLSFEDVVHEFHKNHEICISRDWTSNLSGSARSTGKPVPTCPDGKHLHPYLLLTPCIALYLPKSILECLNLKPRAYYIRHVSQLLTIQARTKFRKFFSGNHTFLWNSRQPYLRNLHNFCNLKRIVLPSVTLPLLAVVGCPRIISLL